MNVALEIALSVVFRVLKTALSTEFWESVLDLVERAETNLDGVPGPAKKEWVLRELQGFYNEFIKENLADWPTFILSMVVDVVVAKFKLDRE